MHEIRYLNYNIVFTYFTYHKTGFFLFFFSTDSVVVDEISVTFTFCIFSRRYEPETRARVASDSLVTKFLAIFVNITRARKKSPLKTKCTLIDHNIQKYAIMNLNTGALFQAFVQSQSIVSVRWLKIENTA